MELLSIQTKSHLVTKKLTIMLCDNQNQGVENLMTSSLFLLTLDTLPSTTAWNPSIGIIMIFANVFAYVIGYFAIQNTGYGPSLPIPQLASQKSFGLPELLATTSFGHILGAGIILGLSSAGIL
jgi:photosystem I subunit 10